MTDSELLAHFEKKVAERGIWSLTCDDRYLYESLKDSTLHSCDLCGGEIKRTVYSVCAGHGDFPRYLRIRCTNCSFEHSGCISYGETWRDVEEAYHKRCAVVSRGVADFLKKQKKR